MNDRNWIGIRREVSATAEDTPSHQGTPAGVATPPPGLASSGLLTTVAESLTVDEVVTALVVVGLPDDFAESDADKPGAAGSGLLLLEAALAGIACDSFAGLAFLLASEGLAFSVLFAGGEGTDGVGFEVMMFVNVIAPDSLPGVSDLIV